LIQKTGNELNHDCHLTILSAVSDILGKCPHKNPILLRTVANGNGPIGSRFACPLRLLEMSLESLKHGYLPFGRRLHR